MDVSSCVVVGDLSVYKKNVEEPFKFVEPES